MGDPKKPRRKFETPRHPWRKDQIETELKLIGEYGLRNKHELWRYKSMVSNIRGIARSMLAKSEDERAKMEKEYLSKLGRFGVLSEGSKLDDILDLDVRNLLERRLQTVAFRFGLSNSIHQARQLITHGHIQVGGRIISVPSYLVSKSEEQAVRYIGRSPLARAEHPAKRPPTANGLTTREMETAETPRAE